VISYLTPLIPLSFERRGGGDREEGLEPLLDTPRGGGSLKKGLKGAKPL